MAARVGGEHDLLAVGGRGGAAVVLALHQLALFTLELDHRAVLLDRQHRDAFPLLADFHRLRIAAVDREHGGLVADHADQGDVGRGGRAAEEDKDKRNNIGHETRSYF